MIIEIIDIYVFCKESMSRVCSMGKCKKRRNHMGEKLSMNADEGITPSWWENVPNRLGKDSLCGNISHTDEGKNTTTKKSHRIIKLRFFHEINVLETTACKILVIY